MKTENILIKSDNFKKKEELYRKDCLIDEVLESNEEKTKISVDGYPKLKEVYKFTIWNYHLNLIYYFTIFSIWDYYIILQYKFAI